MPKKDSELLPTEPFTPGEQEVQDIFDEAQDAGGVRSGAEQQSKRLEQKAQLDPTLMGGDPDVILEDAAFVGEQSAGGAMSSPEQNLVDDIGRAAGVEYQDTEPLRPEKVEERDVHRWEVDPASSEDFAERHAGIDDEEP